jgi:hypothetical protein
MSRILVGLSLLLLVVSGSFMPVTRALDRFAGSKAAASLGLMTKAKLDTSGVLLPILFIGLSIAIFVLWRQKRKTALTIYCLAGICVLITNFLVVHGIAVRRSHAIDSWPICETGKSLDGYSHSPRRYSRGPAFDGPHLSDGTGCISQSEKREVHLAQSPDGDFFDGLLQIKDRFKKDRFLVFGGSAATFAGLLISCILILLARRKENIAAQKGVTGSNISS